MSILAPSAMSGALKKLWNALHRMLVESLAKVFASYVASLVSIALLISADTSSFLHLDCQFVEVEVEKSHTSIADATAVSVRVRVGRIVFFLCVWVRILAH